MTPTATTQQTYIPAKFRYCIRPENPDDMKSDSACHFICAASIQQHRRSIGTEQIELDVGVDSSFQNYGQNNEGDFSATNASAH